jgi:hypothetical protein
MHAPYLNDHTLFVIKIIMYVLTDQNNRARPYHRYVCGYQPAEKRNRGIGFGGCDE